MQQKLLNAFLVPLSLLLARHLVAGSAVQVIDLKFPSILIFYALTRALGGYLTAPPYMPLPSRYVGRDAGLWWAPGWAKLCMVSVKVPLAMFLSLRWYGP